MSELRNELATSEMQRGELRYEVEAKVQELQAMVERAGRKEETMELDFYHIADTTANRWEAQEQRLVGQLKELKQELIIHQEREDNAHGLEGLQVQLRTCQTAATALRGENETLRLGK